MNRLSYGAAGLLLALSLTAMVSSTRYTQTHDALTTREKQDELLNSDMATKLLGQTLNQTMAFPIDVKRQYIYNISSFLTGHKVFDKELSAEEKTYCDENLPLSEDDRNDYDERCLDNNKLVTAMNADALTGKSPKALNVYLHFFYRVAYRYMYSLQMRVKHGDIDNTTYVKALDALKANETINTHQHTDLKNYYPGVFRNKSYELGVNKDDAYEKLTKHYHTGMTSRQQWDAAYSALPEIEKYGANGLNPTRKERLYGDLRIAFTKNQTQEVYDLAKEESAVHLMDIAKEARLEAISSSKTAAGAYFHNHQDEINDMYRHLHNHRDGPRMDMNQG